MNKITSFTVDHRKIEPGIYISRTDNDITTYDMRTRKPNCGLYMDNVTMHTFEHMFATFVRNSEIAEDVIYFGPMGCQTGFYLLVRNADNNQIYSVVTNILKQIIEYDGEVFGASEIECGNYKSLNLDSAKKEAETYLEILENTPYHPEYYCKED